MKTFKFLLLAAVLALPAPAALAEDAKPDETVIPIQNFGFMPMQVTVAAGSQVTWRNLDDEPHNVVSLDGQFRSAALDQGESFSFRFARPGTYAYVCSIHPQMKATIVVR